MGPRSRVKLYSIQTDNRTSRITERKSRNVQCAENPSRSCAVIVAGKNQVLGRAGLSSGPEEPRASSTPRACRNNQSHRRLSTSSLRLYFTPNPDPSRDDFTKPHGGARIRQCAHALAPSRMPGIVERTPGVTARKPLSLFENVAARDGIEPPPAFSRLRSSLQDPRPYQTLAWSGLVSRWFVFVLRPDVYSAAFSVKVTLERAFEAARYKYHRRLLLTVSKPYQNAILSTNGTCL